MLNNTIARNSLPSIDLLYDYGPFLRLSESEGGIGSFAQNSRRPRVGIVGAGISGLVAATELLRAGITDIVLFEARDRMGGRAWSQIFDPREPHLIAEMGAMRFPSSATCLFHYLDKLRIDTAASFPIRASWIPRCTIEVRVIYGRPASLRRHCSDAFIKDGRL